MQKLANFKRSLEGLRAIYGYGEPYGKVELAGVVALFEVCFELPWKAIKAALESHGYPEGKTGSPETVLRTACAAGIIDDEDAWIEALVARNNVSHSCNQEAALAIARAAEERYYTMFCDVAQGLEENWT